MVWTSPATPVTLTPITTAFWNVNARDNLNVLRANTGSGDPTSAGQVIVTTAPGLTAWGQTTTDSIGASTITAVKLASGVALANLGYTPVNRAGDGGITGSFAMTGGDYNTNGRFVSTVPAPTAPIVVSSGVECPNLNAHAVQGKVPTDFLQLALGGTVNAALTVNGKITANGDDVTTTSRFISTLSGAFAPVIVSSTTECPNLNAHAVGGRVPGAANGNLAILDSAGAVALAQTANNTATNSVSGVSIVDGSVTDAKLDVNAVTNTKILNGAVTSAKIFDGTIVDTDINSAHRDGPAAIVGLRTLGLGPQQAAAGNHPHTAMALSGNGSYSGNSGGGRLITSALNFTPRNVLFQLTGGGGSTNAGYAYMGANGKVTIMAPPNSVTDGNAGSYGSGQFSVPGSLNLTGITYDWTAFA